MSNTGAHPRAKPELSAKTLILGAAIPRVFHASIHSSSLRGRAQKLSTGWRHEPPYHSICIRRLRILMAARAAQIGGSARLAPGQG